MPGLDLPGLNLVKQAEGGLWLPAWRAQRTAPELASTLHAAFTVGAGPAVLKVPISTAAPSLLWLVKSPGFVRHHL